jgi:hypothetical protein
LQFPEQRRLVEVVHEGALPVDLQDGEPLAVPRLELGVAGDVDDVVLQFQPRQLCLGAVAEAAVACREQDEPRDRARA